MQKDLAVNFSKGSIEPDFFGTRMLKKSALRNINYQQ
jgi:hypothetical protein